MSKRICRECGICIEKSSGIPIAEEALNVLREILLLDCIRQEAKGMNEDDIVTVVLFPESEPKIMTASDCHEEYGNEYNFDREDAIFHDRLFVFYDKSRVAELAGKRYLVEAPMMAVELDEFGNECSIAPDTYEAAVEYVEKHLTYIEADGETVAAFRLI